MRLAVIVGTRPHFIKLAALLPALKRCGFSFFVIRTGQHYDERLSDLFLKEFRLPEFKYNLRIRDLRRHALFQKYGQEFGSRQAEVAMCVRMLVPILKEECATHVVVIGDSNPAVGGACAAEVLGLPVIHCEAGLRNDETGTDEEKNRVLIDHGAEVHLCSTKSSCDRLREEVVESQPVFTGDLLLDVFSRFSKFQKRPIGWPTLNRSERACLLTVHRTENVHNHAHTLEMLKRLIGSWDGVVVWPVHPAARSLAAELREALPAKSAARLFQLPPATYMELNYIRARSQLVITDSVGVQVESYFWKTPCIALRDAIEHAELEECGASVVLGPKKVSRDSLGNCIDRAMAKAMGATSAQFSGKIFGDPAYSVADAMAQCIGHIDGQTIPKFHAAHSFSALIDAWRLSSLSIGHAANAIGWSPLISVYGASRTERTRH